MVLFLLRILFGVASYDDCHGGLALVWVVFARLLLLVLVLVMMMILVTMVMILPVLVNA